MCGCVCVSGEGGGGDSASRSDEGSTVMKTYFSSSLHLRMRNTEPMMRPKKARAPMMPPMMAPVVGPGMNGLFSSGREKEEEKKKLLPNHPSFTRKHFLMRLICST